MPPQPRHTETSILQSYLLPPSPLPTILPYISFIQLVPAQHRSHPDLKRLYRDLQFQRTIDIDTVRQNITREVARGATLKSQLAKRINDEVVPKSAGQASRKRKRTGESGVNNNEFTDPTTIAIDTTYYNTSLHPSHFTSQLNANHPLTSATSTHHTSQSLISTLASAASALRSEMADLEAESSTLLAEMNEIVGSLSDLRYGRFAKLVSDEGDDGERTVEDEILEALEGLNRRINVVAKGDGGG